jgi:hypothetical protein
MKDLYVSSPDLVTTNVRLHLGTNIVYLEQGLPVGCYRALQDLLFQDCDYGVPDSTYDLPTTIAVNKFGFDSSYISLTAIADVSRSPCVWLCVLQT